MITPQVLLVEDEEDDVFFMQDALKRTGLRCHLLVANNGQEAIEYLDGRGRFGDRSTFPVPDAMLLDLKMPFKDGFEVLEWMKERQVNVPVAVLSSSSIEKDAQHARDLGAAAYFVKPPTKESLFAWLKNFVPSS